MGSTQKPPRDSAGVLLPPPMIFFAGVLLGLLANRLRPIELPGQSSHLALGWTFITFGMLVILLGIRELSRHRTTINPAGSTTALVTGGPYGRTRNPLYLALSLIQIGIGIATGNLWILLTLAPTLIVIQLGVIRLEERYLRSKFGDDYRRYCSQVRRWL